MDSITRQTFTDWELIIVDDASSDGTADEALRRAQGDSRIKVIQNPENLGISATLQRAMSYATGDYIAFIASDDGYLPDKLEKQLDSLAKNPAAKVCLAWPLLIDEHNTIISENAHPYYNNFIDLNTKTRFQHLNHFFLTGNYIAATTPLFNRKALESLAPVYDPCYLQLEDFDRFVRFFLRYDFTFIPERLVYYRIRDNEQNLSAPTAGAQIRNAWEHQYVLENFFHIQTLSEFNQIFPDYGLLQWDNAKCSLRFALSQIAWEYGPYLLHKLFALRTLRHLISCPTTQSYLQQTHHFALRDYHDMCKQVDFFQLQSEVSWLKLKQQERTIDHLQSELSRYKTLVSLPVGKQQKLCLSLKRTK